jgi:valyl-tRNA synthetase
MALEVLIPCEYAVTRTTRLIVVWHATVPGRDGRPKRPRPRPRPWRGATIYVRLEGIIDFAREIERLEDELGKLAKELSSVAKKLHNQDFLAKAPAEVVVAKVNAQQQELMDKQQKIRATLDKIKAYDSAP